MSHQTGVVIYSFSKRQVPLPWQHCNNAHSRPSGNDECSRYPEGMPFRTQTLSITLRKFYCINFLFIQAKL